MSKLVMNAILETLDHGSFSVRYWDGEEICYGPGPASFSCIFHRQPSLAADCDDPLLALGECYMNGDFDLEGDFTEIMRLIHLSSQPPQGSAQAQNVFTPPPVVSQADGKDKQKDNIASHYDLGNDFFKLWLDESMSYSCAYFKKDDDPLNLAQRQKIDLVLKKMRLKPGQRILDIGCGWGQLVMQAAKEYGVNALGVTLSEEQALEANCRIKAAGLSGKVEVRLANYLDLEAETEQFDRIISIGMFEHVGQPYFRDYMRQIADLLKPGGLSMLHTLTSLTEAATNTWIKKYIFPGGYIPSLREIVVLLPDYDFHVLHIESLRRHYVKTLEHWLENFSAKDVSDKVVKMFGERFKRMWALYLKSSAATLHLGPLDVHQIVFSKGVDNSGPMTLAGLYD